MVPSKTSFIIAAVALSAASTAYAAPNSYANELHARDYLYERDATTTVPLKSVTPTQTPDSSDSLGSKVHDLAADAPLQEATNDRKGRHERHRNHHGHHSHSHEGTHERQGKGNKKHRRPHRLSEEPSTTNGRVRKSPESEDGITSRPSERFGSTRFEESNTISHSTSSVSSDSKVPSSSVGHNGSLGKRSYAQLWARAFDDEEKLKPSRSRSRSDREQFSTGKQYRQSGEHNHPHKGHGTHDLDSLENEHPHPHPHLHKGSHVEPDNSGSRGRRNSVHNDRDSRVIKDIEGNHEEHDRKGDSGVGSTKLGGLSRRELARALGLEEEFLQKRFEDFEF